MEIGRIPPMSNQQGQMGQSPQYSGSYSREDRLEEKEQAISPELPADKDMVNAVEGLNKMFETSQTHIQFAYHEELEEYYVKIIDDKNNEVIKEIPSKKILDMVAEMGKTIGLLIDRKI